MKLSERNSIAVWDWVSQFFIFPLSSFRFHLFLDAVHPSARRWSWLVFSRQPVDIFARAIATDFELRFSQVFNLDFDRVAAVNRTQPFVISPGGDDIAGIESKEPRQPGDLIRNFMRHVF